ncbi:MAG: M48 family metallopeptidase [Pseudomonadota bacterium]
MRAILFGLIAAALSACTVSVPSSGTSQRPSQPQETVSRSGSPQSVAAFQAMVRRVEPVAESVCRAQTSGVNCDFRVVLDRRDLPPNAYQTLDDNGRPVIGFTASLLTAMRNPDELAFAFSHEAAHHIAGHIPQIQRSATVGVLAATVLGTLAGLDSEGVESVQNIGGTVGARRYSKEFELEADSLGARIALRAGYDPLVGVQYFARAPDPGDQFLGTHPPNNERIRIVQRTVAAAR